MARKSRQDELFDMLRARGLRKRVAKSVSEATGRANRNTPKGVKKVANDLRALATEIEDRATGGPTKRKAASGEGRGDAQAQGEPAERGGEEGRADAGEGQGLEPVPDSRGNSLEICLEAVVAGHLHHRAVRRVRGHAERVALALHDEHRHLHGVELAQAGLLRLSRGMNGKREAKYGGRACFRCRPAGHPRTRRAPPRDQREVVGP